MVIVIVLHRTITYGKEVIRREGRRSGFSPHVCWRRGEARGRLQRPEVVEGRRRRDGAPHGWTAIDLGVPGSIWFRSSA